MKNSMIIFFAICIPLTLLSFVSGSQSISLSEIFNSTTNSHLIFWEVRFPRTIAAGLVGALLSIIGLQLQTLFKNPLASPSILGLQSGSSLFIALSSLTGSSLVLLDLGRFGSAFLGAFLFATLLLFLAAKGFSGTTILLTGVLLSYLTSAIISILIFKGDPNQIKEFIVWGMGGFDSIQSHQVIYIVIGFFISLAIFYSIHKGLDSLLLGEHYSSTIGYDPKKIKIKVLLSSCIGVATIICFCGPIGFVGLIAPPLAKKFSKSHLHKNLSLHCLLIGFSITLFSDICVRWFGPLPINALLGIFGSPLILSQLLKQKGGIYEN